MAAESSAKIVYREESYEIVGACFAVYNDKGYGFTEPVYQECLAIEFEHRRIPFRAQQELFLTYRGQTLRQTYKPDFICFEKIVLEIKAVSRLIDQHRGQAMSYLKATGFQLALLVNFCEHPDLVYERIANTENDRLK